MARVLRGGVPLPFGKFFVSLNAFTCDLKVNNCEVNLLLKKIRFPWHNSRKTFFGLPFGGATPLDLPVICRSVMAVREALGKNVWK